MHERWNFEELQTARIMNARAGMSSEQHVDTVPHLPAKVDDSPPQCFIRDVPNEDHSSGPTNTTQLLNHIQGVLESGKIMKDRITENTIESQARKREPSCLGFSEHFSWK